MGKLLNADSALLLATIVEIAKVCCSDDSSRCSSQYQLAPTSRSESRSSQASCSNLQRSSQGAYHLEAIEESELLRNTEYNMFTIESMKNHCW